MWWVCFCILYSCKSVSHCHLWPVWLYHIFPNYFINSTIFGEKLLNTESVFWFPLLLLCENFVIPKIIHRDVIHVCRSSLRTRSSCKILMKLHFPDKLPRNPQITNFVKFRPVGVELFHAAGQTDEQTDIMKVKVASRKFCERAWNFFIWHH